MLKGIDISKYQNVDWESVKNIDFVIIRAGYGMETVDPKFKSHTKAALSGG